MTENREFPKELSHEPVPGYRKAFFVVLAAGVAYLGVILGSTAF